MVDRADGRVSWTLDPYSISLSFSPPGQGAGWFGPLAPMRPMAPAEVAGRQWDYAPGWNLATQPRGGEPVPFATLRQLADGWDLLRLVIETRKDQISRMAWSIRPRDGAAGAGAAAAAEKFLRRPDGAHGWGDWLRLLLEELFVIDAPALYCRRDRAGRLVALHPLDGTTIKPAIDAWGRTPQPYKEGSQTVWPVAYQQILKGFPAADYSTRDLIYRPRNPRLNHAYGFSPVEQIVTTVNIALRRQLFLMDYYTEGNIPDSLIGVPDGWTPDQISSYQKYWDAYFSGEAGKRRRAKFVPGSVAKSFVQTKEPELKNAFDDWLARIVCFAFSVSPQALVSQMNRATAEVQKTLAEEEGFAPVLAWVKALIDDILADELDAADCEFVWQPPPADPAAQAQMLIGYCNAGILTRDEARGMLGRAPLSDHAAGRAMKPTGTAKLASAQASSMRPDWIGKADDWDENHHPRWPAGSNDSQEGRFKPDENGSAASSRRFALDPESCVDNYVKCQDAVGGKRFPSGFTCGTCLSYCLAQDKVWPFGLCPY